MFLILSAAVMGCGRAGKEPVRIFAAASTREALAAISRDFKQETGVAIEASLGPSSELARQLERGADGHLFLSADESWADYLEKKDMVQERRDLLANQLVVITPAKSSLAVAKLDDLAGQEIRRLALAGAVVPAGRYAREALTNAGVWPQVQSRVLEGGDVRAALTYVARGEAEAGIVYATDARMDNHVRLAMTVDPTLHSPIRYPLVLLRKKTDSARAAFEFLHGPKAAREWQMAGFTVVGGK
jgi:molybdate transport system substrate-binding protein